MALHLITAAVAALALRYKAVDPVAAAEVQAVAPARSLEPMQASVPGQVFVAAYADAMDLQPAPIRPEWVLSGNPIARVAQHSNADDGFAGTAVWDCTAGSFRWFFHWDETVYILEGSVHVTAEDGTQRVIAAGDIAYFKGGTWATWRVDSYVRKVAFLHRPVPRPVAVVYRLKGVLRAAVKRMIS